MAQNWATALFEPNIDNAANNPSEFNPSATHPLESPIERPSSASAVPIGSANSSKTITARPSTVASTFERWNVDRRPHPQPHPLFSLSGSLPWATNHVSHDTDLTHNSGFSNPSLNPVATSHISQGGFQNPHGNANNYMNGGTISRGSSPTSMFTFQSLALTGPSPSEGTGSKSKAGLGQRNSITNSISNNNGNKNNNAGNNSNNGIMSLQPQANRTIPTSPPLSIMSRHQPIITSPVPHTGSSIEGKSANPGNLTHNRFATNASASQIQNGGTGLVGLHPPPQSTVTHRPGSVGRVQFRR
eukprot:CAMPEP_0175064152 /NCGR_PEP_ID=MMETSP0052_2-20121109/15163_1 /TAXON_ID=51329 ORGANISM="Polytomella parva, Strain SAG 63-3" /NCGR_SAMPLE_ID=MMETSP0052_2 /ASSEMBLY_ACC=CAM_ASM_000194 /LENGTH=300 /DNA_ID=CAMNT_0016330449 /DNA_START=167 /DNA_END=1072 /DNA_ORIENTATION=+